VGGGKWCSLGKRITGIRENERTGSLAASKTQFVIDIAKIEGK